MASDAVLGQSWPSERQHLWDRTRGRLSSWLESGLELFLIVAWALWFGRVYLDLGPSLWPHGDDFPMHTHFMYIWSLLRECGACMLWHGSANGGAPALADQWGGVLHPLFLLPALFLHPVSASKLSIIGSLAMAGIGQWWLARVMGLRWVPRIWVAMLAVVAGHLAGRMYHGQTIMLLSIASASLVPAAALDLALTGHRRAIVLLALTLALTIVSGHGYMQFALLLSVIPALLIFVIDHNLRLRPIWKSFAVAGLLGLLLSGVYLVPLLHFFSHFGKNTAPNFIGVQLLEHIPLNLVIRDAKFFMTDVLGKNPVPTNYVNYIGWIPVFLAALALRLAPRQALPTVLFFLISIALLFIASAAIPVRWLAVVYPGITAMRQPNLLIFLAVPLILALAAWGLELLLRKDWPMLQLSTPSGRLLSLSIVWLVMALPLIWSIQSVQEFTRGYMTVQRLSPSYAQAADLVQLDSTQWVDTPFGDMRWHLVGLDRGFKVVLPPTHRQWAWRGRDLPPAYMTIRRDGENVPGQTRVRSHGGLSYFINPQNEYAFIQTATGQVPCQAHARGGDIDVDCPTGATGTLIVREYNWTGWSAARDGVRAELGPGQWLTTPATPEGRHYQFRYRPWDVPVGLFLTLAGMVASILLWRRPSAESALPPGSTTPPAAPRGDRGSESSA